MEFLKCGMHQYTSLVRINWLVLHVHSKCVPVQHSKVPTTLVRRQSQKHRINIDVIGMRRVRCSRISPLGLESHPNALEIQSALATAATDGSSRGKKVAGTSHHVLESAIRQPVASPGFWARGPPTTCVFTKSGRDHRNFYIDIINCKTDLTRYMYTTACYTIRLSLSSFRGL